MAVTLDEFLALRNELPIVDVRSQGEFQQGHVRSALNIPLLNNEERIAVGTDYKQNGQQAAIKTGFRLVGPRLEEIIKQTERLIPNKEMLVHCWRGGMRSNNFCQFIGMAGMKSHALKGGYKAYRQQAAESFKQPFNFIVITGCTGSGKSEALRSLKEQGEQVLDLEDLAKHKGSAFGGLLMPEQPTTEQFQNELFEEILLLDRNKRVWVEDESIAIGKIFLPSEFWKGMNKSPLVQMDVSKEVRIQRLVDEYGPADRDEFLNIMGKITTKLGGQHYNQAKERLSVGDMHATIDILLTYYDKAYLKSIEKRKQQLKFSLPWDGNSAADFTSKLIKHIGT